MLSSKSAEILSMVENNQTDKILDMDTFSFLESKNYIAYDGKDCAYVTPEGIEALEDYFHYMKTLDLSRQSIKKSSNANVISIVSLVVSGLLSVAALFISIFVH